MSAGEFEAEFSVILPILALLLMSEIVFSASSSNFRSDQRYPLTIEPECRDKKNHDPVEFPDGANAIQVILLDSIEFMILGDLYNSTMSPQQARMSRLASVRIPVSSSRGTLPVLE
jgi:hypothetical protein